MVKKASRKLNIPLQLAAILLCLTLISLYLVSGLLAKYTAQGENTHSARVASFAPKAVLDKDVWNYNLAHCKTDNKFYFDYPLIITNASEVDVSYHISISFKDNSMNNAVFTINSTSQTADGLTPLEFKNVGTLDANNTTGITQNISVTITEETYNAIMENFKGDTDSFKTYFDVAVMFTQVD